VLFPSLSLPLFRASTALRSCAELYYLYGTALALEADQLDGDELFGPQVPFAAPDGSLHHALKLKLKLNRVISETEEHNWLLQVPRELPVGAKNETEAGGGGEEGEGDEGNDVGEGEENDGGDAGGEAEAAGGGDGGDGDVEGEAGGEDEEEKAERQAEAGTAGAEGGTGLEEADLRTRAWEVLDTARLIFQKFEKRSPKVSTPLLPSPSSLLPPPFSLLPSPFSLLPCLLLLF
jgi:hypothetical protein